MANLMPEPEDLSSVLWTKANTNVTADQGAAPDSTNTADDVIHTSTAAAIYDVITVVADTEYFLACFIHVGNTGPGEILRLTYRTNAGTHGVQAWFDLGNEAALGTSETFGTGATLTGADVKDMGDGWYWVYVAGQLPAGETTCRAVFAIVDTDGSEDEITSSSMFIWGVLLDEGSKPSVYTSEGGTELEWDDEQAPPYIAVTRRRADEMIVRPRMPKPRNTLRGNFE